MAQHALLSYGCTQEVGYLKCERSVSQSLGVIVESDTSFFSALHQPPRYIYNSKSMLSCLPLVYNIKFFKFFYSFSADRTGRAMIFPLTTV